MVFAQMLAIVFPCYNSLRNNWKAYQGFEDSNFKGKEFGIKSDPDKIYTLSRSISAI